MSIDPNPVVAKIIAQRVLGGPGSGNFGHAGRPGEVGGSASWTNPSHRTAQQISGVTPENAPLKTYKAYHVTRHANAESILKSGFDLNKVKPRWQNDLAVSLSRGEKAATDYFSHRDPKTGKPIGMDTSKYALLEVTVKGRLFKGDGYQTAVSGASSPRDWTNRLIEMGLDGQDQGATIFVNNPKAILSIRAVTPKAIKALGGPGSGNFGHAGRPGEVGGSASGAGSFGPGAKGSVTIYHQSEAEFPSEKPHFDAFFGSKEFTTVFTPDFGPNAYAIEIPRNKVIDLENDSQDARDFRREMAMFVWPDDVQFRKDVILTSLWDEGQDTRNDFYEMWTDKDNIAPILKKFPGYEAVHFQDEFFVPKKTLDRLKGKRVDVKTLGGPGSGNFGHSGRPGRIGGSSSTATGVNRRWPEPVTPEEKKQDTLALAQTNPLAHPEFVLGLENDINGETLRYVAAYGQEFKAAPLPEGVERGTPKECYRNTTHLIWERDDVDYAEGFATSDKTGGLVFMHAWAVTKDGTVIDPTFERPENSTYFGVRYDRKSYLKHTYKTKFHGVLGADFKSARKVIETGGKDLIANRRSLQYAGIRMRELQNTPGTAAYEYAHRDLGGLGSGNFGHAGRPGQVGGSSPSGVEIGRTHAAIALGMEALGDLTTDIAAPDPIEVAEDLLRDTDAEKAIVYDGEIPKATYTMNHPGAVFLPSSSSKEGKSLRGLTITHNHPVPTGLPPGTDISFSLSDLKTAVSHNLQEIRAVTPNGTFSLKRLGSRWPRGITRYTAQRLNSSLYKSTDINEYFNDVWRHGVAEQFSDVRYTFEPKS